MNHLGVVHPDLLTELAPTFFPASATVQQVTETQSASGMVVESWAAVSGLTGLAARVAPRSEREIRQLSGTYAEYTHTIGLASVHTNIHEKMRVVVGADTYDITGVRVDGNTGTMWLSVRRVV